MRVVDLARRLGYADFLFLAHRIEAARSEYVPKSDCACTEAGAFWLPRMTEECYRPRQTMAIRRMSAKIFRAENVALRCPRLSSDFCLRNWNSALIIPQCLRDPFFDDSFNDLRRSSVQ
jgi:hypothetical protein